MEKLLKTEKQYRFQYALKFICTSDVPGTSQTSPGLPPGSYQTAVNIHNPWEKEVILRMKLTTAGVVSKFLESKLEPDGVDSITCGHIDKFDIVAIHGFEGFLVIESNLQLDVAAVYTAAESGQQVVSMDVEYIRGRKIKPAR